jgi:hypothetical protein
MKTPSLAFVLPFLSTLAPVLGVGNAAALPRHHLEPDSPKFYFPRQIKRPIGEQFVNKSIPRTTTSQPPRPSTTVTSLVSVPTGQSLEQYLSQLLSTDLKSTTHPPNAAYPVFMADPTADPTGTVHTTPTRAAGPAIYHHPLSTPPSSSIAGTGGVLPPVIPPMVSHATKALIPGGDGSGRISAASSQTSTSATRPAIYHHPLSTPSSSLIAGTGGVLLPVIPSVVSHATKKVLVPGEDDSGRISAASSQSGSAVSSPRIYSPSGVAATSATYPSRGKYSLICLHVWAL